MRLSTLAEAIGARLLGEDLEVERVASIQASGPTALAPLIEPRWRAAASRTRAAAVLCSPALSSALPPDLPRLVAEDARDAWGRAVRLLHPRPFLEPPPVGIDPRAVVEGEVHPTARVAALAWVGPGATVGPGAVLHPFAHVGAGASVGEGAVLHPRATVLDGCAIGAGVLLCTGAVVGSPGFGLDAAGRVPQLGVAVVEDDATIGANSCVDRAALGETRIGRGSRLDNLVQVGHGAWIGPGAVLCGQVGVAGGARVEAGAVLGGQAGVSGHVTIGEGARVAAQSGVTRSLPGGGVYSGHPAEPNRRRLRRMARLRRLAEGGGGSVDTECRPPYLAPASVPKQSTQECRMTPKQIFEERIASRLADPDQQAAAKEIDAVYQFNITGDDGGEWVVNLTECTVSAGTHDEADCTITVADEDFVSLVEGTVPGPQLFMMGKLQVGGNMGLAMKLSSVIG